MADGIWKFLRALSGGEGGRWCRSCDEAIARSDLFGQSEGVCTPCRTAP